MNHGSAQSARDSERTAGRRGDMLRVQPRPERSSAGSVLSQVQARRAANAGTQMQSRHHHVEPGVAPFQVVSRGNWTLCSSACSRAKLSP
jgi:hypothetical protein